MTVQNMRDYVRAYLDTDETEMPDSLLNVWMDEGTSRIQRKFEPWSFYETAWEFETADPSVPFATIDSACEVVQSVEADRWMLHGLPHENALSKFAWSDSSGSAYWFSTFASTLFLWPNPDSLTAFTARGYRAPTAWSAATDSVDVPVEFHPLICEWMLARAYEQQDDEIMSSQKFSRFEQQLDDYRRRYLRAPSFGVQVIGGHTAVPLLASRLAYDFE